MGFSTDDVSDHPLFQGIPQRTARFVRGLATAVTTDAGDVLVTEGEPVRQFCVVFDGTATVTVDGAPIASLGPGHWFGELSLLAAAHGRTVASTATVTAGSPMRLGVFSVQGLTAILDASPEVERRLYHEAFERLLTLADVSAAIAVADDADEARHIIDSQR